VAVDDETGNDGTGSGVDADGQPDHYK